MGLAVQLISGAVGGNIGGALLKQFSLGPVGNSIAGIVGGGIGGQILGALMGGGGIGGIIVMIIVGVIKNMMGGKSS